MSRFTNTNTGVVFSVDDSKDDRYGEGFEPVVEAKSSPKSAPSKSK